MEITNFEMRNYDPIQNINFKGFCIGGDKSNSCWIANFVPFDQVTDIYLFESAIDAMSFYEINHFNKIQLLHLLVLVVTSHKVKL